MWVEFGNDQAIEGYRDENSDDPDLVRWREAPGQRITRFEFPEGTKLSEALAYVANGTQFHFAEHEVEDADHPEGVRTERHAPAWVESDSEAFKSLCIEQFGLAEHKAHRTKTWGKEFGLHKNPALSNSHPANEGHTATDDEAVRAHREAVASGKVAPADDEEAALAEEGAE